MKWYTIPAVCVFFVVVHYGMGHLRNHQFPAPVNGTVISKYTAVTNGDTKYRVVVERYDGERETFEFRDTWASWRSADDFSRMAEGRPIRGTAFGWRWGFLSHFRRLQVDR